MKPHHFIAPALALAGSAYWLIQQNNIIQDFTTKIRVIGERVVVQEKNTTIAPATLGSPNPGSDHEFTLSDGSLDWETIVLLMSEEQNRGGGGPPANLKIMLKIRKRFMTLSEEELISGIEKLNALDLEPELVTNVQTSLLDFLAKTNPLAALKAMGDPVSNTTGSLFWTQYSILSKTAKKDPAAAAAWLDRQIADGKLVSNTLDFRKNIRLKLEEIILNQLVPSDLSASKQRLQAFSEEEKAHLLSSTRLDQNKDTAEGLLQLTRESLSPDLASETITKIWTQRPYEKLADISAATNDVPFTGPERQAVVEGIIRSYFRNKKSEIKLQDIYEWSRQEHPGQETTLVILATGNDGNHFTNPEPTFKKIAALAATVNDPSLAVEFVASILEQQRENPTGFLEQKFTDPGLARQFQAIAESLPQSTTDSE